MDARPSVSSEVLATVIEDAPDRVRRKLDREPGVAADWNWQVSDSVCTIRAGEETVRLNATNGVIEYVDDVCCSCLLSPRCYHLLACLSVLEVSAPPFCNPPASNPSPSRASASNPPASNPSASRASASRASASALSENHAAADAAADTDSDPSA